MNVDRLAHMPGLRRAIPLKRGVTSWSRGSAPDYVDDGPIHVVGQAANQENGIDWRATRFHAHIRRASEPRGILEPGDILVNSTGRGTLGRVGYFEHSPDYRDCLGDGHVTIIRVDESSYSSRFLYYWLRSNLFQDYLSAALVDGATNQIELNRERLGEAPIPDVDVEEQRGIANYLDNAISRIDRLREISAAQRALLDEKLMEELRIRTVGGDHESAASTGIPWMPFVDGAWRMQKVARAFATFSGTTPSVDRDDFYGGRNPWVNSSDLNDGRVAHVRNTVSDVAIKTHPALRVAPKGALVLAMYGQGRTKGRTGLLEMDACLNQACVALVARGSVDVEYAQLWLRAHREGIVSMAYGAGQPNLSQELVRSLRIPTPGISEQRSMVYSCQRLEWQLKEQASELKRRESLLVERRDALITAAVTGQIDVTTARGVEA